MPVSLGSTGQASFNEPLELLKDCHRRIESFLDMLLRVVDAAHDGTLNDERRRALDAALRYFREAAPRHTQDEEESLFPRLRQNPSPAARDALDRIATLEADHRRADEFHETVERTGQAWLAHSPLPAETLAALKTQLEELRRLYQRHIQIEDTQIFPLAAKALDTHELASLGQEMKARRAPSSRLLLH